MTKVRVDRRLNPILRIFNYFGSGMEWLTDSPEARDGGIGMAYQKRNRGKPEASPSSRSAGAGRRRKKVRYPYDISMI